MILVVTGGIGSGKSLVCSMLAEHYGIPVYEADKRVKSLYAEVPSMLNEIESAISVSVRNSEGEFVPQKLAEVIFSDPGALAMVENIVFPHLRKDFASWMDRQVKNVVAFESATLLEKPQFDGFGDVVLLIDAPVDLRLLRASERDGADERMIRERISKQKLMNRISDDEKDPRVNYIILNDTTKEKLRSKLDEFMEIYGLTKML